jgi:hypothetical protein
MPMRIRSRWSPRGLALIYFRLRYRRGGGKDKSGVSANKARDLKKQQWS